MATAASPRQMMYTQILSQPALLLEVFDATERRPRRRSAISATALASDLHCRVWRLVLRWSGM